MILSCVLAYINIDFIELLKILNENIFNPEIVDKLISLICKWYTISIFSIFGALLWLLPIIFFNRNKKNNVDILTWGQAIYLAVELVLLSQGILPLFSAIMVLVIALLYLVFFSSMLLKNIIGYGTYLFVLLIERICTSSGID